MNTCDTCKWWRRGGFFHKDDRVNPQGEILIPEGKDTKWVLHSISVSVREGKYGLCLHPAIRSDCSDGWLERDPYTGNDGVIAECDEQRAGLSVFEKFGCIHHEPK
jgi:hypothetical protein